MMRRAAQWSALTSALARRVQTHAGFIHHALAAPRLLSRGLCTSSGSLTAMAWLELAKTGSAPPPRFPVGTPVKCFVGDGWLTGKVVLHKFREQDWPAERPSAPYQVLLDAEHQDLRSSNAIFAPADVDELICTNFRFPLGASAECRVGRDEWVRCTVVGHLYREETWPAGQFAPYQVKVGDVLPGSQVAELEDLAGKLTWLPKDNPQNIRHFSDLRWERLQELVDQRQSGSLDEQAFEEQRKAIVHDESCSFYDDQQARQK